MRKGTPGLAHRDGRDFLVYGPDIPLFRAGIGSSLPCRATRQGCPNRWQRLTPASDTYGGPLATRPVYGTDFDASGSGRTFALEFQVHDAARRRVPRALSAGGHVRGQSDWDGVPGAAVTHHGLPLSLKSKQGIAARSRAAPTMAPYGSQKAGSSMVDWASTTRGARPPGFARSVPVRRA